MSWSREDILLATGGKIVCEGKEAVFNKIVTDSAKVKKGSVFVALKGMRFDGHSFLKEAVRLGARCLVVHKRKGVPDPKNVTVVMVRDTLKALGDLAHYHRKRAAPKVLAITGSNGKTMTKEMVAAILEQATLRGRSLRGKVLSTAGNYNNLVGLPLTLLRLQGKEEIAVLELGTSRPGEIRRLTEIADPDVGLITTVAPAHLAGLRNIKGVAREKGQLFRGIKPGGVAVVNSDDPWVRHLGKSFKGKKIFYGSKGEVQGKYWKDLGFKGIGFTLQIGRRRQRVRLRLSGEHNILNAVGAAAMAHSVGVGIGDVRKGLETVRPQPMRMEMEKWQGIGIINDAYNANPASMKAAIKTLARLDGRGKRIAVLGDMLELGKESRRIHLNLGKQIALHSIDRFYLFGKQAGQMKKGILFGGVSEEHVIIGKTHKEIARKLRAQVQRGDWLLFKGSRGMRMEQVLAAFKKMGA
jgi:UDP-N-acetylmuramoyl-tripeptide--D-alanyl-D-alanine ligase